MKKTKTLRAENFGDLLAMVPHVLGFHPEDSLVLMTLGEAADCFHARVDLPETKSAIAEVVTLLLDAVERHEVTKVAIVVYSEDQCLALEVAVALGQVLDDHGVTVAATIRADGRRWFSLSGCTEPCCPPQGTVYDVSAHPLTAQSVLEGQVILGSRRELADSLIGTDSAALAAVEEAADAETSRFTAAARHPLGPSAPNQARAHLVAEGQWVRETVCGYLGDGRPLDAADAGRLLVAMIAIDVRDVAWAEMTRDNAAQHVRLWRDVLQRSPYDLMAAPAGLLAFAAWLSGDGALAWCAVDRCQQVEPDYRLAGLLTSALANAVPPSVWKPIDRDELSLFAS